MEDNQTTQEQDDFGWKWSSWQVILIMLNALIGLIAFEYAWKGTYLHRNPNFEINEVMPMFRRRDTSKWRKWKFYPGAVTFMIPRLLIGISFLILLLIVVTIFMIGQPAGQPLTPCRRVIIRWAYKATAFSIQLFAIWQFQTWKYLTMDDVDNYEEWLGPIEQ